MTWLHRDRPRSGAFYCLLLLVSLGWGPVLADNVPSPPAAAIASAHPLATEAGMRILRAGGNAFDAAVAVSAALAVVEPYSSGMGGGGFWLLHRASDDFQVVVDGRERAPLRARRDMYLDDQGVAIPDLSINGPLAGGIPGQPAALAHISELYGRLSLAKALQPAIELAEQGFEVDAIYRRLAGFRLDALRASAAAAAIFLDQGEIPDLGYRVRQSDLAWTLQQMARAGRAGFYRGKVADRLLAAVRASGGIWTRFDLESYRVLEREPIRFKLGDLQVVSVPPPSSGGTALATMLNTLSGYPLAGMEDTRRTHLIVESMRRAYRDRAEHLGDSDYVEVPVALLTHPAYAAGLRAGIRPDAATPSNALPGFAQAEGGQDTTHFSILDDAGNRVSATLSINYPFGSCFVAAGTGVLINDEMDDFSIKPGVPNAYGLVGAEANAIEPGKRMLSSMSPSFLEHPERIALVGTPGGSRIITMVLLATLAFQQGASAEEMVRLPRFHHQYLPDRIQYEAGAFSRDKVLGLQWLGHELRERSSWGNMQVVVWDLAANAVSAASDPRGVGQSLLQAVAPDQR